MLEFLSVFCSYLLLMIVIVVVAAIGFWLGLVCRKLKNKKKENALLLASEDNDMQ